MSEKTVFIGYRRDVSGKLFARAIKEALTHYGYDVFLDVDDIDAGKWATQILTQVPKRAHFLLLLTPGALDRCSDETDWVRKEFEKAVDSKRNIVPVREESVDLGLLRKCCPLGMTALFDYEIPTVRHSGFENDIKELTERYIHRSKVPAPEAVGSAAAHNPAKFDISRIDKYAPAELIGREAELALLNDAWARTVRVEKRRPRILTFVALGGEGKTSLVAKWAAGLAGDNWPGCDAAFGWSFYDQGTREQAAASSELFLSEALTFFGDPATAKSAQSTVDKARHLAKLVGNQRALLVLDGLEPLQYAPTAPTPGELKDEGIAALLKSLALSGVGLCVVTTRYAIPDLNMYRKDAAPEYELKSLSIPAGVALLKGLGVNGAKKEFETLVKRVDGHALTLNLLGSFLKRSFHGDIRQRDRVKFEKANAKTQTGHAFRTMAAYEESLLTGGEEGRREVAILRLLGLFDRPAGAGCLNALRQQPIAGLTEAIFGLEEDAFAKLTNLEQRLASVAARIFRFGLSSL